jgi:hypothetical protein
MHPAFRSTRAAIAFCALMVFLLGLPMMLSWAAAPSREQNFISMTNQVGPVGYVAAQIYDDREDTDVLFVGSSRLMHGVDIGLVQKALGTRFGRPARVVKLALNWPGEDLQSYMLREYLERHRVKLLLWNLPQPRAFSDGPHPQAFRWIEFNDFKQSLSEFSPYYSVLLYSNLVLGAPRQALAKLLPNLLANDERSLQSFTEHLHQDPEHRVGFLGRPFVPDSLSVPSSSEQDLMTVTSPLLDAVGPFPGAYQLSHIHRFADEAKEHGTQVVLLHIPDIQEFGGKRIPELASWDKVLGPDYQMIAVPANELFNGIDRERFLNFFADNNHFNRNGETLFTERITPSILRVLDHSPR